MRMDPDRGRRCAMLMNLALGSTDQLHQPSGIPNARSCRSAWTIRSTKSTPGTTRQRRSGQVRGFTWRGEAIRPRRRGGSEALSGVDALPTVMDGTYREARRRIVAQRSRGGPSKRRARSAVAARQNARTGTVDDGGVVIPSRATPFTAEMAEREGFEPSKGFWPLHP
jgi:hypothetical protein